MIETDRSDFLSRRNHLPPSGNSGCPHVHLNKSRRPEASGYAGVSMSDGKAHLLTFFLQNPSPTRGRDMADTSGGSNDRSGGIDHMAMTAVECHRGPAWPEYANSALPRDTAQSLFINSK